MKELQCEDRSTRATRNYLSWMPLFQRGASELLESTGLQGDSSPCLLQRMGWVCDSAVYIYVHVS